MPQGPNVYYDSKLGKFVVGSPTPAPLGPGQKIGPVPGSETKSVPPPNLINRPGQRDELPAGGSPDLNRFSAGDVLRTGGQMLGTATSLVGGTMMPTWLTRMLTVGAGGGINATARGENPLEGAGAEMLLEGIFNGVAPPGTAQAARKVLRRLPGGQAMREGLEPGLTGHLLEGGLSEAVPYAGHRGAMFLAGTGGDKRGAANAALRLREPIKGTSIKSNPVNLANQSRVDERMASTAAAREAVEKSSLARVSPKMFQGASNRTAADLRAGSGALEDTARLKVGEEKFIKDQGIQGKLRQMGIDPTLFNADQSQRFAALANSSSPRIQRRLNNYANQPNMNMYDLGEVRRLARKRAEETVTQRVAGTKVDPADVGLQEGLYSRAKDLQDAFEPGVIPHNKKFGDLFKVQEAIDTISNTGRSSLGAAGVRGGTAHGVSENMTKLGIAPRNLGSILGPLAVVMGAGPMTKTGAMAGTTMGLIPTVTRAMEDQNMSDPNDVQNSVALLRALEGAFGVAPKPKVTRRGPK